MSKNMGAADRFIRFLIAIIFAILFFADIISGTFGIVLLVIGIVLILTSFTGVCPLYKPFGIHTNAKQAGNNKGH